MLPFESQPSLVNILASYLMDLDDSYEWQKQSPKVSQHPKQFCGQAGSCCKKQCVQDNCISTSDCKCRAVPDSSQADQPTQPDQSPTKPIPTTTIVKCDDLFTTKFDLQSFDPSEISVKLEENTLVVRAKHVHTSDGHYEQHEYIKKVPLPDNLLTDQIRCTLDQSGHLQIEAPYKQPEVHNKSERVIPIEFVHKSQEQETKQSESPKVETLENDNKSEFAVEDIGPE